MLTPQNPGRHPTNTQLSLLEQPTKAGAVPLRVALQQVAHQWSMRLDHPVHVIELSNGGGYRIERTP